MLIYDFKRFPNPSPTNLNTRVDDTPLLLLSYVEKIIGSLTTSFDEKNDLIKPTFLLPVTLLQLINYSAIHGWGENLNISFQNIENINK